MGDFPYRIGLDIGIASVGWSVLEEDAVTNEPVSIEDLGVRIFDRAENPKNGDSLALPRRKARSVRRRLRRRKHRLERLRKLFVREELLSKEELQNLYVGGVITDVWQLRVDALHRKLEHDEFARVLIHLAKRRGFKSNRKSEETDSETTQMKKGLAENKNLLENYETVAQMVVSEEKFQLHKRNKGGEYTHTFARADLEKEIHLLFKKQREFGHPFASTENETKCTDIWSSQRPFSESEDVWKKVGECTFEKGEKRAPKVTFTFQSFMVWDKINKIRLVSSDGERALSDQERGEIYGAVFSNYKQTYYQIRKLLKLEDSDIWFKGITYDPKESLEKNEKVIFVELKEQKELKKLLEDAIGKEDFRRVDTEDFDTFGYALTVYKDDKDIRAYLKNELVHSDGKRVVNLSRRVYADNVIEALLQKSFTKFGHLSLKAMRKIIPGLQKGLSYDEACLAAGYNFRAESQEEKQFLLPTIPGIPNPVVMRALTQTRKVVNAIIKRYGSPTSIHVELAREMQKDFSERQTSIKDRDNNHKKNRSSIAKLSELGLTNNPRGHDIVKMKLYEEQQGICAYSLESIDPGRLLENGYVEVDHILPYSRSLDNSYKNKVLVLGRENQNKQNRIPYEYFGENKEKWGHFEAFVNSNPNYSQKKRANLTRTQFLEREEKEFRERNLSDTRYATRFFSQFLRDHLLFAPSTYKQKVFVANGAVTAYLRSRWDFNKDREANDLHHATDAVIVACATHMVQKVTYFHKRREQNKKQAQRNDKYFPQPWEGFSDELKARLSQNPKQGIESLGLVHYDPMKLESLEPVFVSRKPRRSVSGAAHGETYRRVVTELENGKKQTAVKTKLEDITFTKEGHFAMYGKETDPATYNAIRERFLEHGGNKKVAFKEKLYKPTKTGEPGNQIKTVRIFDVANQVRTVHENQKGVYNASIVRTDVFERDGKFYCVPVYTFDVSKGLLPQYAINANKPYSEWTKMTAEYTFKFSLYPNDVVFLQLRKPKKEKVLEGVVEIESGFFYFRSIHSATAGLNVIMPDGSFEIEGLGSKTLQRFEKYQVDVLGNLAKVKEEKRVELAPSHNHKQRKTVR